MPGKRVATTRTVGSVLVWISAGCGAVFLALAVVVAVGWDRLIAFDQRWSLRAYSFMQANGWCEALARAATWLGSALAVTVVTLVVAIACAVARRRLLAAWLAVTVAGGSLVNTALKYGMERVRPATAGVMTSAHGFAFPSGHTEVATVTYPAVVLVVGWQVCHPGPWSRRISFALVCLVVGAVGLSRVFLGAHWPTDVLGGWLFGSAWVTAAAAVLLNRVARAEASPRGTAGEVSRRSKRWFRP